MIQHRVKGAFFAFLAVSFLIGTAAALQMPTLSLFLTNDVKVGPLWVGLFYALAAIAGVVASTLLGRYSDRHGDRRRLLLLCCLLAVANCTLFAFSRSYGLLLAGAIVLSSIANASVPQLFALAREYADQSASKAAMFNSLMRAQMSLAWVLGPPLAFMLAINYGFRMMFLTAAVMFVLSIALIAWRLPSIARVERAVTPSGSTATRPATRSADVTLLFLASLFMWTSNGIYIIDMPLYITQEMGLPENLAGLLMGLAAGLEIPFMLLAGYLAPRLGKRRLMLAAVAAGVLFYAGMVALPTKTALVLLQPLNALFIGVVAGIGILYFQDLMPGQAGAATTLFTNSTTTGVILAGVLQGVVAQYVNHYATYILALALVAIALALMWRVREA